VSNSQLLSPEMSHWTRECISGISDCMVVDWKSTVAMMNCLEQVAMCQTL